MDLSVFYIEICVLQTWWIPVREHLTFAIKSEIEKQIFRNLSFPALIRRSTFAANRKLAPPSSDTLLCQWCFLHKKLRSKNPFVFQIFREHRNLRMLPKAINLVICNWYQLIVVIHKIKVCFPVWIAVFSKSQLATTSSKLTLIL